ncbi:MAG: penicillin acylase family protein [Chlorobi bacterium]|nr:penicillin acylase family protein [Chlorobiota bacterium]
MKFVKRLIIVLLVLIILILAGTYIWLRSTKPVYDGTLTLKGLKDKTEIIYDEYAVPHIYAANAHDAYFALGYAQAQERLFQMVMIRRATSGRLSEILGKEFIGIDKTMRTLSIRKSAERNAKYFFKNIDEPYKHQALAYLEGINSFIENGNLPVEFTLIGFKPEKFTPADIYTAIGYMSLGFTAALSQEPMVTYIHKKLGDKYLVDFGIVPPDTNDIAENRNSEAEILDLVFSSGNFQDIFPLPVWNSSNNWAMSKERSKSGKVLLANDTHIKYSQPAVWYEAHLNYPGFEMFGYYLPVVPFPLMGHNRHYGWGLTIFPFDNMDLYRERQNPDNANQYWSVDHWENYRVEKETIRVKEGEDMDYDVRYTRHGPVLNDAFKDIAGLEEQPVSLWWASNELVSTALQALYRINNANDIADFEQGVKLIDLLGLNVVYGDADNNIAWWGAGSIPKRPPHVNPKLILDGASGKDDVLGFHPFDYNPKSINPPDGFLCTTNNPPPPVNGVSIPGYYFPGYRAKRIEKLVTAKQKWDAPEMKQIQLDNTSDRDTRLVRLILENSLVFTGTGNSAKTSAAAIGELKWWDGSSNVSGIGVTIYNQLLYFILRNAMLDELGEENFDKTVGSVLVRSSLESLLTDKNSVWWDDISTQDKKETREDIFTLSLTQTIDALTKQFGEDVSSWQWGKVHTLTHVHPIGRKKPFDKIFNVGPFAKAGSNEVIDKEAFEYSASGIYPVKGGPAMRLLLDFGDPEHALSIIPTGQSGNIMSPHYADQAEMFVNGEYRIQYMDKSELKKKQVLMLVPEE